MWTNQMDHSYTEVCLSLFNHARVSVYLLSERLSKSKIQFYDFNGVTTEIHATSWVNFMHKIIMSQVKAVDVCSMIFFLPSF